MTSFQELSLHSAVRRLRGIAEPTRVRLVHLLTFGELSVTEITQVLGQSQPRVSRHLKLLLDAGIIERFPEGAWVFYRLADGKNERAGGNFLRALIDNLDSSDPLLAADRTRLASVKEARAAEVNAYFEANATEWMRVRSLYQPVAEVEAAMLELLGSDPVDLLIDLGTGTGRVLEVLSTLYTRAIGFDTNHAMLSAARVSLDRAHIRHAHVRHGNLLSLEPVTGFDKTDVVVLHQVLHYLDRPEAAVAAAARLLAPGGRLLIVDFLPHELEFLRTAHAHRRLGFTDDEIQRCCSNAGLEPQTIRHVTPQPSETTEAPSPTVSLWLAQQPTGRSGSERMEMTA